MKGTKEPKLERLELSNKPKLIITEDFKKKINFLHSKVGAAEWSGELITSEQGKITDLDNWTITAEDIFLVDIGTSGSTSYEVDKGAFKAADVVELYDAYPGLLDGSLKAHHIHSHHNMTAFFSGTDWENLEERTVISNYFLMLIVNFAGEYKAKVGFKANLEGNVTKIKFANNEDGFDDMSLGKEKSGERLVVMDCEIEYRSDNSVSEEFEKRYERVKEAIKEEEEKKRKSTPAFGGGAQMNMGFRRDHGEPPTWGWQDQYEDSDYEYGNKNGKAKETKIIDMTDKEWNKWEKDNQWSRKDFHTLFNAVIDNRIHPTSFDSCLIRMEYLNKKIKTAIDRENLLTSIHFSLREIFDKLYPGKDDYDYACLMNTGREILEPFWERDAITKGVYEILEEEIVENLKTI